jgi:hypothetical protein
MLEILSNIYSILILSILFGITVKIADLLDEHGLKWFRGSTILFGVLWGFIGGLLILSNNIMANFFIAILLHWILRYRIDYLNHGIAASIMFIIFIWNLPNFVSNWLIILLIFIPYSLFGAINDYIDRHKIKGNLAKIIQFRMDTFIFPLILTIINIEYWIILASSILQVVFYMATTHYGMKIIKTQKS